MARSRFRSFAASGTALSVALLLADTAVAQTVPPTPTTSPGSAEPAAAAEEDQNDDQDQPHAGAVIVVAHLRFTSLVMLCLILCGKMQMGA